jgi:hypothetical protein
MIQVAHPVVSLRSLNAGHGNARLTPGLLEKLGCGRLAVDPRSRAVPVFGEQHRVVGAERVEHRLRSGFLTSRLKTLWFAVKLITHRV